MITEWISWPWVFYVNIPIALGVLIAIPALLPAAPARRGSIDIGGALTATAGLALTVFGASGPPRKAGARPRWCDRRRARPAGWLRRHPGVASSR